MPLAMEFIIKVILAVIFGFWFYRDSRGRDYSWPFWTFLPIVIIFPKIRLGILGVLFIFVIYIWLRPQGKLSPCPHCRKKIYLEGPPTKTLFKCPFCQKNAKRECLNCHEPVSWEAQQCPFCKSRALTKE